MYLKLKVIKVMATTNMNIKKVRRSLIMKVWLNWLYRLDSI